MTEPHSAFSSMGVVATLSTGDNGRIRLTLDDVSALPMVDATTWRRESLFTFKEYDASALHGFKLSRDQFAEIGENIVMRLLTLGQCGLRDGNYRAT